MRLNRKQKILRNLILSVLLSLVFYACLGFPVYTVKDMCRQMAQTYLLEEPVEPLYILRERNPSHYDNQSPRYTFVVARSGDTYISFQYERNFLKSSPDIRVTPKLSNGALCTGRNGTLYVAGPFAEAASATAEVRTEKTLVIFDPDTDTRTVTRGPEQRTFTYQGEKVGDELFTFRYRDEDHMPAWTGRVPESEYDLENVASEWYIGRLVDAGEDGGHSLLHADLPVRVTLFDEAGGVLETLDLTVDTYELRDW